MYPLTNIDSIRRIFHIFRLNLPEKKVRRGALHCVISVRIGGSSVPYFPAFGLNTERYGVSFNPNAENIDQKNSEYGHFSRIVKTIATVEYFSFWKKSLL